MRNKKAKLLRKEARALTVGMKDTQYEKANAKKLSTYDKPYSWTSVLVPSCTRAVYQRLKRVSRLND